VTRFPIRLVLLLVIAAAAGCAAGRVHQDGLKAIEQGDYEEGFAKLEQAVKEDPGNLEYRLDYRARKEAVVQQLIAYADRARATGRPDVAESTYQRVLGIAPGNDRAQKGLTGVQADRHHAERTAKAEKLLEAKQLDAADLEVHAVLAEDPGFAPATALAAKIDLARGPTTAVPRLRTHDSRPVSLQFRDAQTKMVFEVLARQTGINFVFDKDVKSDGKTTIFVNQAPVEQAIDLILTQNQLARQVLSDTMVFVYPNTPAKQKDYQDEIVRTFYLANAAPKDAESMLKTMLSAKTLFVDERTGVLAIRDTPEHVRMAEKLIASLDVAEPEVLLEVEVLEISRNVADQIGINYPTNIALDATSIANPGSKNLVLSDLHKQNSDTITVSPIGISIDLLKTVGNTNVLSSPRIRARNKEKAKVLIGDRVPVVTSGSSATTGGTFSTSNVQYLEVGLTLDVQPTIHLDGNVAIKMGLEVSTIVKTIQVPIGNGGTTLAYQIGTRNANTTLELRDGETQVLAGLIQDSDQRNSSHIPGLGDLPILGRLFGSVGTTRDKSEIVLAITPRIIRAQQRPSSETTEFWYGSESQSRSAPFSGGAAPSAPTASNGPVVPGGVSFASGGAGAGPAATPSSAPRAMPTRIEASAAAPAAATAAATTAAATTAPGAEANAEGAGAAAGAATAPAAPAAAPGRPTIAIDGPETAKVGDEISVAVKLSAVEALGRLRAQVRFDAGALQLVSAEPGAFASSAEQPKVDLKPGGVQLDVGGTADAPVSGVGDVLNMRFKVVAARPVSITTQVVLVGADGAAVAATPATPLKITVAPQ
jgi:general secretion pathway protein D